MLNNDRLLVQILLLVLFGASLWVMASFWSALFWGAVLAFASWPLMRLLTRALKGRIAGRGDPDPGLDVAGSGTAGVVGVQPGRPRARRDGP